MKMPDLSGGNCWGLISDAVWFPPRVGDPAVMAKRICKTCPLTTICLEWALEAPEKAGVWGGTTPAERTRMTRQASRARTKARQVTA